MGGQINWSDRENKMTGRTRNFKAKIAIERDVLSIANQLSLHLGVEPLFGLSQVAVVKWTNGLSGVMPSDRVSLIENCLKELARATGLMADQSRCAVSEQKVSVGVPSLFGNYQTSVLFVASTYGIKLNSIAIPE